MFERCSRK